MARLSVGRRLMLAASRTTPASNRWRLFRQLNGVRHLRELDLPYYQKGVQSSETTRRNDRIDIVNDRTVFRIDHGYATHNGVTLTPDGAMIRELSREWNPITGNHSKLHKPYWKPEIHRVEKIASITIEHNTNYCHFFYDCIPRIGILRENGFGDLPIYAPLSESFQQEILDLMGYPKERRIASFEHRILQAGELYVPSYDGNQGEFPERVRNFIRTELLALARARRPEIRFPRRLYISRKDSTSRRILNEDALFARLQPLGFEFLVMAEMSVLDQILAFADASCIVTPHGASLTNLVFCPPECSLVEIFPPRIEAPCYQDLSRLMGMRAFEYRAKGVQLGKGDLAQDLIIEDDLMAKIMAQVGELVAV
jgi:capsular polysaccharide biosynthesis protein